MSNKNRKKNEGDEDMVESVNTIYAAEERIKRRQARAFRTSTLFKPTPRTRADLMERIRRLPGFADMPDDATEDDLYRRCAELRAMTRGKQRGRRYFNGKHMRWYVGHCTRTGVKSETLRLDFGLDVEQWALLMNPEFNGTLVIQPPAADLAVDHDDHKEEPAA